MDRFPMASPEAKALMGSWRDEAESNWSSMKMSFSQRMGFESPSTPSNATATFTGVDPAHDDDGEEGAYGSSTNDSFDQAPRLSWPQYIESTVISTFAFLYGPLPLPAILRVFHLSLTLFFMIGGYWLLRSLKDPVLASICGVEVIPKAKMVSVLVVLCVVTFYNALLDRVERHKLFYYFGLCYFVLFGLIATLLSDDEMGLPNAVPDPGRMLGWVSYCTIESFGSLMVSLFWSFTNSITPPPTQKSTYGFLTAVAQIGSILGPTVVRVKTDDWGIAGVYWVGAFCMLGFVTTIYTYVEKYGCEPVVKEGNSDGKSGGKKSGAGILEGLSLFVEHDYVKGIFAISCLFMVEVTIVDFTMKMLAKEYFDSEFPCDEGMACFGGGGLSEEGSKGFASFMGTFGQATNTLSFLFSFLGTSMVIRTLGLRLTLLLFPSLCLGVILLVRALPDLWVVFGAMMLLKGFSYALNNPTKEILYQPTSQAVKYKSKSWIDIFGARGSKALGSVVTNAFSDSATDLVQNGSLVGAAVACFLIFNARFMGKKYDKYTEMGFVVGGDNSGMLGSYSGVEGVTVGGADVEMVENDDEDTACGIEEEGQSEVESEGEEDEEGGGKEDQNL